MICTKCSAQIPIENAVYCPFCAAQLTPQLPTEKESSGRRPKSRGNSQGSVYRRGNSWVASVTVGWRVPADPSKPRYPLKRTKAFKTKREAVDAIPSLKIEKPKITPKLSYYWDSYKATGYKNLSDSAQTKYRIAWEKRLTPVQNTQVDALTVKVLQSTIDEKCSSFDTAKDCKNLLSNLFRIAAADGYVSKDIPSLLRLPEHEEKEREVFTEEEQKKLWACYENGNMDCAIPLFMLYSGAMPGETMHLRTDMIDLERRIIVGAGMKTKVRRETPIVIADCLVPVLEDLIAHARPDGFLWIQSKDDFYQMFNNALTAAGIDRKLTPYCCRHSFATALAVTENIAPVTIRRVMRWSTTKMLDRYAHPNNTDALDAVDKLKK